MNFPFPEYINTFIISGVEMDIWEPCNYVSNLAYDRLLVEICVQQVVMIDSFRSPGNIA